MDTVWIKAFEDKNLQVWKPVNNPLVAAQADEIKNEEDFEYGNHHGYKFVSEYPIITSVKDFLPGNEVTILTYAYDGLEKLEDEYDVVGQHRSAVGQDGTFGYYLLTVDSKKAEQRRKKRTKAKERTLAKGLNFNDLHGIRFELRKRLEEAGITGIMYNAKEVSTQGTVACVLGMLKICEKCGVDLSDFWKNLNWTKNSPKKFEKYPDFAALCEEKTKEAKETK